MLPKWILRGKYGKTASPRRSSRGQGRAASRTRQLRLERLEIRSLLSCVPGLSSVATASSAIYSRNSTPAVTQLVFQPSHGTVQVGVPVTVQLVAVNNRYIIDSAFSDTVTVATSDKAGTVGSISFVNGVATFSATFNAIGSQTLTATDTTNSSLDTSASFNVFNPAVATQLACFCRT